MSDSRRPPSPVGVASDSSSASYPTEEMVEMEVQADMDEGTDDAHGYAFGADAPPRAAKSASSSGANNLENQDPNEAKVADPLQGEKRRPVLIYKAYFNIAVFHVQQHLDSLENIAITGNGYLVSRSQNNIQIRIPAKDFRSIIQEIVKMGDVRQRDITVQDVTAEFTDTEIRLKNALALRVRLEALLQDAKVIKDALRIESELARVTNQIERMKGRLKLLRELSTYSTITVDFAEQTKLIQKRVRMPFPWLNQLGLHYLLDL